MRQFRIGEGDPRNRVLVDLAGEAKQRIPDHQPGMIVGDVGELRPARGVANGVDAPVGGAQVPVDPHALAVVADAGPVETEIIDICPPAGRDQQMAALDCLLARSAADDHAHALPCTRRRVTT